MEKQKYIFNHELLEKQKELLLKAPVLHVIAISASDENTPSYCLMRTHKFSKTSEIILAKTMRDRGSFEEEVKNLAKYFDAHILKDEL